MALSRRGFLRNSGSCAAHIALAGLIVPRARWMNWLRDPLGQVVAQEKFGRLEKVAEGVWALVSDPLSGDRTTLANGGIIAGKSGVMAIEGFFMPKGATWLAEQAKALTGKWPTHVVLTHYHADHVNGLAGYSAGGPAPRFLSTPVTQDQAITRNQPADSARTEALRAAAALAEGPIDLGGRKVRITNLRGHTDSDSVVTLDDPQITFCGDLVWNGIFPNYVDAKPSALATSVASIKRAGATYVPGHGAVARDADFDRYVAMLGAVEEAARKAQKAGTPAVEAANSFALPPSLGEWTVFAKPFFERAFAAWYKELGA